MRKEIIVSLVIFLVIPLVTAQMRSNQTGISFPKPQMTNTNISIGTKNITTKIQVSSQITNFVKCVRSNIAKGMSKKQAAIACRPKKPIKVMLEFKCSELRQKIKSVSEKIGENPDLAAKYMPLLTRLKAEYKHCLIVSPTGPALPADKCEQYRVFSGLLKQSEEELQNLEDLVNSGQLNESTVKKFEAQTEMLKERVEKLKYLCGTKTVEPPCKELYILTRVKDHLQNLANLSNSTESQRINQTIKQIEVRITQLKKLCSRTPVTTQVREVKSLQDLSDVYNARSEETIENITQKNFTRQQLITKLRDLQNEKKELIKNFVTRMKELNLQRQNIIQRLRIGRQVQVEGMKTNISKINVVIGNQSITITPGSKIKISVANETAEADIELELENNTLVDPTTNKTIKILPTQLKHKFRREKIRKMILKRLKNKPVYEVQASRPGRLLGFIPVTLNVKHDVDATSGNVELTVKPWWSFLVLG